MTVESSHLSIDESARTARKAFDLDDLAVWPDGTWATLGEVWNGDYDRKSDDYEKVDLFDTERLCRTGNRS